MGISELRAIYHKDICRQILYLDADGIPNIADKSNSASRIISQEIVRQLPCSNHLDNPISGQTAGNLFEKVNREFLGKAFEQLRHLRPGKWEFEVTGDISKFQQYEHLANLEQILEDLPQLKAHFGSDYLITPDVIVARYPAKDKEINKYEIVIEPGADVAAHTPLREVNHNKVTLILHASVSVKWTLRSDRAQNARTEALNLIRNRKGHTPRIVAVTAEPTPSRIASLALGTGDMDCVYHFALPELEQAVRVSGYSDSIELMDTLVQGGRLRDISDLPFDLVI